MNAPSSASRPLALALALAALALSGECRAQGRGEFDRLVRSAVTAYDAGDAPTAIASLQRAYAIRPVARILYNLGRAHELGGDFATAVDYYQRFLATNPSSEAAAVAREALGVAQRRAAEAAEAQQQRRAAEEAERQRAAEAERARTAEAERARAAEAERARQMVGLSRPREVTAPMWALWGVAGLGAVSAGVLGALALNQHGAWSEDHRADRRADAADLGQALALGTDIAWGTAVVSGAVGLVLYLVQPGRAPVAAVAFDPRGARAP
jgi:tetratricopeptide (TPR) repeat protein